MRCFTAISRSIPSIARRMRGSSTQLAEERRHLRALSLAPGSDPRAARPGRRPLQRERRRAGLRHIAARIAPSTPPTSRESAAAACCLIRTFMDDVSFNSHGNQIVMLKNRAIRSLAAARARHESLTPRFS